MYTSQQAKGLAQSKPETKMKKTLKQIREEATNAAKEQKAREAADQELKESMDKLRAAESKFYEAATRRQ